VRRARPSSGMKAAYQSYMTLHHPVEHADKSNEYMIDISEKNITLLESKGMWDEAVDWMILGLGYRTEKIKEDHC